MKDKSRITLMVCTAADGSNSPLAIVGKPKKTSCFAELSNKKPSIAYINHRAAWFDKNMTLWWIKMVFWPHHLKNTVIYMLFYS